MKEGGTVSQQSDNQADRVEIAATTASAAAVCLYAQQKVDAINDEQAAPALAAAVVVASLLVNVNAQPRRQHCQHLFTLSSPLVYLFCNKTCLNKKRQGQQ